MRIALDQLNPTVGDVAGNARDVLDALDAARDAGADLLVTPELALVGYPPKDLLGSPVMLDACERAVEEIAERCVGVAALVGTPWRVDASTGLGLTNAAVLCAEGRVVGRHDKRLLPTYDVFDERRYFDPGDTPGCLTLEVDGRPVRLGVTICEDLWNDPAVVGLERPLYDGDPVARAAKAGADVLVNCSASPFAVGKPEVRRRLLVGAAQRHGLPIAYCNQVGGNDELVFDGGSRVLDARGRVLGRAKRFEADTVVVDLPLAADAGGAGSSASPVHAVEDALPDVPDRDVEQVYHALVLGLGDYVRKCGFQSVVLGLSGGIDSAVAAALSVAAVGPDRVRGLAMPSRYSSEGSVQDALALAKAMQMRCDVAPIEAVHASLRGVLGPVLDREVGGLTDENLQARARGVLMMGLSNDTGAMLVTTGNKSELAVGYCTLYGDMAGGLAVLSDVPKTWVYRLARWINDSPRSPLRKRFGRPVIPQDTIDKPPSAELRPDQKDADSLPDYDLLDAIIERYVERVESVDAIVEHTGIDADEVARVVRMIDRNEYKRRQAAPGLKVTGKAFGFGRRMPIAQRHDSAARGPEAAPVAAVTSKP
ncbi:MAG: NAD+ synthase [Planctomycetota bacterium]